MEKKINIQYYFLIVAFTFALLIGFRCIYDNISYNGYQYPIYISEKLITERVSENCYEIRCQFTNLTDEDVIISKIHLHLSGVEKRKNDNLVIYDDRYLTNITVPANGKYDLIMDNVYYPVKFGTIMESCVIDGKKCNLQYSADGITFKGPTSMVTSIIILIVAVMGNIVCIYRIIKNRKYNVKID